ncbi:hypothetical protein DSO57_1028000 [Entomophthora muscae]|uniref:Uncharacterized protein n=1 Tax=Entomophthora muscae TaxID=34485 RepID=A0ACC2TNM9_9FUNG|nr:hypothetical protein DSO57_1028000 [Entomophthora muscae]
MQVTRSRKLIQLMDKLKDEGAADYIDVSASLLVGEPEDKAGLVKWFTGLDLCGILCHRCPVEFRLLERDDDRWSCNIYLQMRYNSQGKELPSRTEMTFQSELYDQAKASLAVRRAQKAFLNPSQSFSQYRTYLFLGEEKDELNYTRNVLRIEISGAKANLTLMDLPALYPLYDTIPSMKQAHEEAMHELLKQNLIVSVCSLDWERGNKLQGFLQKLGKTDHTIGVIVSEYSDVNELALTLGELYPLRLGYHLACYRDDSLDCDSYTEVEYTAATYLHTASIPQAFAQLIESRFTQSNQHQDPRGDPGEIHFRHNSCIQRQD